MPEMRHRVPGNRHDDPRGRSRGSPCRPGGRTGRLSRGRRAASGDAPLLERLGSISFPISTASREAQRYFEAIENVITSTLKEDQEVQITGFGKFYAREQKAREGVNPQTGEKMHIAARKVPAFSAGNGLKESI